jgi:POT family proton-dependent oligopeptide transporter
MECVLLLVLFFNIVPCKGGWAWSIEDAMALVWNYTMSVYFIRNWRVLADRYLGIMGSCARCFAMTLGHASMAVETPLFFIY